MSMVVSGSVVAMTAFYVWGGLHYLAAARTLPADLARPLDDA